MTKLVRKVTALLYEWQNINMFYLRREGAIKSSVKTLAEGQEYNKAILDVLAIIADLEETHDNNN